VPKRISTEDIAAILAAVEKDPEGASRSEIEKVLRSKISPRTLQFRLKNLVEQGRIVTEGESRAVRYRLAPGGGARTDVTEKPAKTTEEQGPGVSKASQRIRRYLRRPPTERKPAGYNREFLDSYRPNVTAYLSRAERAGLAKIGQSSFASDVAGTYAKQLLGRLLIDLSWNSSRLEGNTYSLLDTKRLIQFGQEAAGRDTKDAQMIRNHKDAIEFLVNEAEEIGFNRYTILNLHGILAQNLLADPGAAGRLRRIAVGIERSTFHPLAVPQLIDECFNEMLAKAAAIEDAFEQAFFIMVQLPYLQPFDDVNKRVSRLAANIPFIKRNLSPLSFTDVPRPLYTDALLGVYELNGIKLLKDVFIWAYGRSAGHYAAVRQSLGEPDPFRFRHSAALRQLVAEVIKGRMERQQAAVHIAAWTKKNITEDERPRFQELAETELINLHEGNFARYQVRPTEFKAWQEVWTEKPAH
jgi:DNA-binding HxlR family transcriptional regulator